MRLLELLGRVNPAMGRARPADLPKPSRRKLAHGHQARSVRRMFGHGWTHGPVLPREHGDPETTGRSELGSERGRRRRAEARCRAGNHAWPSAEARAPLDGVGPERVVRCRRGCGAQLVVPASPDEAGDAS